MLQQLYNVIDAVVAGQLVNADALPAIGVSVPIYLLFTSVIGLIIGNNEAMIFSGYSYFQMCLWFYPVNAIVYGLGGVLSGAGDTLTAGIYSLASIMVKMIMTVLLVGKLGLPAVGIASCCGWHMASLIVAVRYKSNHWKSKAVAKMM